MRDSRSCAIATPRFGGSISSAERMGKAKGCKSESDLNPIEDQPTVSSISKLFPCVTTRRVSQLQGSTACIPHAHARVPISPCSCWPARADTCHVRPSHRLLPRLLKKHDQTAMGAKATKHPTVALYCNQDSTVYSGR